jgi:predicted nucleic acid-binding protein
LSLLLFDSDVVLDLLLQRDGYLMPSASLFDLAAAGLLEGAISSASLTDIWYIVRRQTDWRTAREAIGRLVDSLTLLAVDRPVIISALRDVDSGAFTDFEDAVQHAAAEAAGADAIITRNTRDFAGARLKVLTPTEYLTRH